MMARAPTDLQAVTKDVKARIRHVIGELEQIEHQHDPIFQSPRDVYLDIVLCTHHLEAALHRMKAAWWTP